MSNNKPISKDNVRWFHFSATPLLCGKAFVILGQLPLPKGIGL